ncbi:MAG: hypothetical protein KDA37_12075 [Planctomycetales bacterium]|nr:hypothetical protein [Planctomycetales bacterium]
MAAPNRATRINKLVTAVKKHFKPAAPAKERTLLEDLVFACLLENSSHEAAEEVYDHLKANYFDWNEVRVSTRRELAEEMKQLNDPEDAADRLKRTLQSVFEALYTYDLELLKKQNLGQTVKQFQGYKGITSFVISYATQHSLGGHSIPVNQGLYAALVTFDVISEAEAKKGVVPGLERTVPKTKGVEIGSMLHQLGVEVGKNPYGQNARKILLAIDPGCKTRLPKRPSKPGAPPAEDAERGKKNPPSKRPAKKVAAVKPSPPKPASKASPPKKAASKSPTAGKKTAKSAEKKKTAKKKPVKKTPSAAKSLGKKTTKKVKKKTTTRRKPK